MASIRKSHIEYVVLGNCIRLAGTIVFREECVTKVATNRRRSCDVNLWAVLRVYERTEIVYCGALRTSALIGIGYV